MSEEDIYQQLNQVFQAQFKDPCLTVSAETKAEDVKGWDSLAHIRLVISIEKKLGVKFKTSEVSAFENVGDLVKLLLVKKA